jgi:NAD-dependent aldehyde dehydrogenases
MADARRNLRAGARVMKVDTMDQAIELANDSSLGLTGSVWSSNTRDAVTLGRRIHAGVITINDHLLTMAWPKRLGAGSRNPVLAAATANSASTR